MKKAQGLVAAAIFCFVFAGLVSAQRYRDTAEGGHVIAGRVVDPHQLRPEGAVLMLGREDNGSFGRTPIPVSVDGSFVTPRLKPDTYILEIVRTPHTAAEATVGFSMVRVGTADVRDAMVAVRRDTAIAGSFRMESDNPNAEWPPHIVVSAALAVDGKPRLSSIVADGAPAGKFVLRNAFGPRVVRCGYTRAPGERWWPSRVMLDGVDITNVPTDFSAHENRKLEVVFTQHPARISGVVADANGAAVRAPWILVMSADRRLWQEWATTSAVAQGDTKGRFSLPTLPGAYLVRAVPQETFHSWVNARQQIQRFASGGVRVEVSEEREVKTVQLTLHRP